MRCDDGPIVTHTQAISAETTAAPGPEAAAAPTEGSAAPTAAAAAPTEESAAPTEASAAPAGASAESNNELLRQIDELLDDRVRPALAGDGGGLEIIALEDKTLHIRYQGACGSCPSSIAGTLTAIQNLIQTEIDEELQVVSA